MAEEGMPTWYELLTGDAAAAKTFYGDIVGRTTTSVPGLGGAPYEIWNADGVGIGGGITPPEGAPSPIGLAYFHVKDVEAKADDVVAAGGGSVIMGPMDVPGGQRIILCMDPTGASVGIVSGAWA